MKLGYITMTWRQSRRGGIAGHPTPKNSEYKNPLEKFSPLSIFWDQDSILPNDYLLKGQTTNVEYYSSLLVQLDTEGKTPWEGHKGELVLA